jgi:putative endopeptidase
MKTKTVKKGYWGFDTKRMDTSVRPQDDFYRYVNGNWLKKTKMPPQEAYWGSFSILHLNTQKQLKALVEEISKKKNLTSGSPDQLVRDLYRSGMDMKLRNKLGATPIKKYREQIHAVKNHADLMTLLGHFHRLGISAPWGTFVDQDSKNSSRYVLHISQSGLGLPDREYYLKDEPEFLRVRNAYKKHIANVFKLLGYKEKEASEFVETIMKVETELARISMDKVDVRDVEKTYHKKSISELGRLAADVNWKSYFKLAQIPQVPYVIVTQPEFVAKAGKLLKSIPVEDWKIYLEWNLASSSASFLSNAFTKENFEYYGKTIMGSKKMKPEWRRVLQILNGTLGEALGKLYVERHFGTEAKKKMDALVDDLFIAYEKRIKSLDWMSADTKKKAITKLKLMARKIGYPKKFKTYAGLKIDPSDYFGNVLRAGEFDRKRQMAKLRKPIDRAEWHMSPQTVNAYCNFNLNEIVFPAAILQPPFFDLNADDAINYGAIGAVIGHEMTHGFDDQGAKFDGKGNMKNWWKSEDNSQFEKKGKMLATQYDTYKVAGDLPVNGKLTLGENIADLGGAIIALEAYEERLKKTGRKDIAGFTPEERFFIGFAQAECGLARDEFLKMQVLNDPHSPSEFRVNGPVVNIQKFHDAYKTKQGDKLYKSEKEQVRIW